MSPILAAGCPLIVTDVDPFVMLSGGPAQMQMLPTVAAGCPPIITLGGPINMIGPPVCGVLPGGGLVKGQLCVSPCLAAAGITECFIN